MVGRFDARSQRARTATRREVAVDTRALHFFDPETGARDLRRTTTTKGASHEETASAALSRWSLCALASPRPAAAERERRRQRGYAAEAGSERRLGLRLGHRHLDRRRSRQSFQAVLDGFKEKYPNVTVKYNPAGDNLPTVLATAVAGRQPARPRDVAQPGLDRRASSTRAQLKPIDFAKSTIVGELRPVDRRARDVRRQALRPALQGGQQVDRLVQRPASTTPASSRRRRGTTSSRTRRRSRPRACRRTRSAARTAGRSPTSSRTSTSARRGRRSTTSSPRTRSRGRTSRSRTRSTEMAQVLGDTDNIAGGNKGALQTDFPTLGDAASSPTRRRRRMVIEGDFVAGAIVDSTTRSRRRATTSSRSRRSMARRRPVVGGGDIVIMFKDSPAAQALVEVPRLARRPPQIWVKRGGFSSPNKNLDDERLSGSDPEDDGDRARRGGHLPLRPVRPAAGCVRRDGRPGPVEALPGLPRNPSDVDGTAQKMEDAAKKAYGKLARHERRERHGGASPEGGSAERRAPGRWRQYALAAGFLAPAAFFLGVWIVYPTIHTIVRSFYGRDGSTSSSGSTTTRTLFTTDTLVTAIKNNAIWVAVVPALRSPRSASSSPSSPSGCAGRSPSRPSSSCPWRSPRSRRASPGGSCTSRTRTAARSTRGSAP